MLHDELVGLATGDPYNLDIYSDEAQEVILKHIGTPDQSGRYKRGSGKNPQHNRDLLTLRKQWKSKGLTDKDIAKALGLSIREYNSQVTLAHEERREEQKRQIKRAAARGATDKELAAKMGLSESTVRKYRLDEAGTATKRTQAHEVAEVLKNEIESKPYLEVGLGTEVSLGVKRPKMDAAIKELENSGDYVKHTLRIKQVAGGANNYTTVTVLTKKSVDAKEILAHKGEITPVTGIKADAGDTRSFRYLQTPTSISWDRVKIKYAIPEGEPGHGTNKDGEMMDGCMLINPKAKDLNMGNAKYAQVRIAVGDTHYLKGMAVLGDAKDFPKGVDVIFNTNKTSKVAKEDVLKPLKGSLKEMGAAAFGAAVDHQNKLLGADGKPVMTTITKNGKKIKTEKAGALNIISEEGDWAKWSKSLSAQFLSKQRPSMVKERLDATMKRVNKEYDDIAEVSHPYIRKKLLESYSRSLESKQVSLKAAAPNGFRGHVLLPLTDIKENEVFAPQYKDGDRVILIRYPHGGTFEIPELKVNNKIKQGRKLIGTDSVDAIGIHPKVAHKLSGADFDGDVAYVLKNNSRKWISRPALKELEKFDPNSYADDPKKVKFTPITKGSKYEQKQMGIVSNLITDMTLKGASDDELVRAVKHSMVVIDSGKHKLNYQRSAKDNRIKELVEKYQTHIEKVDLTKLEMDDPRRVGRKLKVTAPTEIDKHKFGKTKTGASTIISRHKQTAAFGGYEERYTDRKTGKEKVRVKGSTTGHILSSVKDASIFLNPDSDIREHIYVDYVNNLKRKKTAVDKEISHIKNPKVDKKAAYIYGPEVKSLRNKVDKAKANYPRERQAQALANALTEARVKELGGWDVVGKDDLKKIKSKALSTARDKTGAHRTPVVVSDTEWDAIMNHAVPVTVLESITKYMDDAQLKELGTPRKAPALTPGRESRIKSLLANGYTIAQVADATGLSTSTITRVKGGK